MLKIFVNDTQLVLPQDFNIRIKRRSPLFVRDSLGKEFTYPILIPFDGVNQQALGFINRQDIAKGRNTFPCRLSVGAETSEAILTIYEVTEEGYDGHMKFNQGALDDILKGKTLSSALAGQIISMGDNAQAVRNYAGRTVSTAADPVQDPIIFFPIKNEMFYEQHSYHGQQFGSRVLIMWPEDDIDDNSGQGFYIGTYNKCTSEVKRYTFTYVNPNIVKPENEFLPRTTGVTLEEGIVSYLHNVRDALQAKNYLKDWQILYTTDVGLPIDKYEPIKKEYNGLLIVSNDEDIVFFNAVQSPFDNNPELWFCNQKSPNENLNHWGYLGEQQFTIDEYREKTCLLRIQNAPDGWPFYHVGFNLVPQIRVPFLLRQIFRLAKASISGVFENDPEMSQLIMYCNYAIDKIEELEFMETLHPELTISRPDEDVVTPGTQVEQLYKVNTLLNTIDLSNITPEMGAAEFVISLLNHFGLALIYDNNRNAYSIKELKSFLQPRKVIDWTSRPGILFGKEYNDSIKVKSIKDNQESKLQCVYQRDLPDGMLKGEVENRMDLEVISTNDLPDGSLYYVRQENAYYVYEVNKIVFDANKFAFYAYRKGDIVLGNEGLEVDSKIIAPYMHKGDTGTNPAFTYYKVMKYRLPGDPNTDESWGFNYAQEFEVLKNAWKVPHIPEAGTTPEWKQKRTNPALRLLFYRGMRIDDNGYPYPYASSDVTDYSDSKIGERAVFLHGPYGTYEKSWKAWINALNNSEIHYFDKQLLSWEILNPNWEDHIKIENQYYLIYEIEAVIDLHEIKQCRQTLIRL